MDRPTGKREKEEKAKGMGGKRCGGYQLFTFGVSFPISQGQLLLGPKV
jgi:hypothetical protein